MVVAISTLAELPDGTRVDISTESGVAAFLSTELSHSFLSEDLTLFRRMRGNSWPRNDEVESFLHSMVYKITQVAKNADREVFRQRIPASEIQFWLDCTIQDLKYLTTFPQWIAPGNLDYFVLAPLSICEVMCCHAVPAALAFQSEFLQVLGDFLKVWSADCCSLSSERVVGYALGVVDNFHCTMMREYGNELISNKILKKLEETGVLAEVTRFSTIPHFGDSPHPRSGTFGLFDDLQSKQPKETYGKSYEETTGPSALSSLTNFLGSPVARLVEEGEEVSMIRTGEASVKSPLGFLTGGGRTPFVLNTTVSDNDYEEEEQQQNSFEEDEELGWGEDSDEKKGGDDDDDEVVESKDTEKEHFKEKFEQAIEERNQLQKTIEMQVAEIKELKVKATEEKEKACSPAEGATPDNPDPIVNPARNDILLGGKGFNHPGNKFFREFVKQYTEEYDKAPRGQKRYLHSKIREDLNGRGIRFLYKKGVKWIECIDSAADKKIENSFRAERHRAQRDAITNLPRHDIMLGTGRPNQNHPGNVFFREFLKQHAEEYYETPHFQRGPLYSKIRKDLNGRGIRFLYEKEGKWIECIDSVADKQISQTFTSRRRQWKKENSGRHNDYLLSQSRPLPSTAVACLDTVEV
mmetsp:Transcript_41415/g.99771  ORF Transcript_41415/g.99771 Transcript_41415/m.99771 type:complete len:637 (+) Transcript_41415:140-2050(+)